MKEIPIYWSWVWRMKYSWYTREDIWFVGADLPYHELLDTDPPCMCPVFRRTHHLRVIITWINTLRPRQNGSHFPDDTFKHIFVNENARILIEISLKFVPKDPINNIPALVQIMAWRRPGDKPLSEPMMASLLTHICVTRPQWVNSLTSWDDWINGWRWPVFKMCVWCVSTNEFDKYICICFTYAMLSCLDILSKSAFGWPECYVIPLSIARVLILTRHYLHI